MTSEDFTIGGVIRRTFGLIGRNLGSFTAAAAVLVFLPGLLSSATAFNNVTTLDATGRVRDTTAHFSFLGSSGGLLILLPQIVLYGIVIRASLGDLRGEHRSVGADIAASFRLFVPNLVITILFYLGCILGYILLVVPGLILQCAWLVAVPAYMAERPGVFGAFGRSRALTAGYRWRICGLLLLYGLVLVVLGGANVAVTLSLARSNVDGGSVWAFKAVTSALSAALNLLGSAGAAVIYIELNRVKHGALSSDVLEAFA